MTAHLIEPPDGSLERFGLEMGDPMDLFWRGWRLGVGAVLDALAEAGHLDEIAGCSKLDDDARSLRRQAAS